ncbi:MAG TPA: DUF167 domain-containing protein [Woeseiaceae bacterium]
MVAVRVQPRAKHNDIRGISNGRLQIRTTAPPADGKANRAAAKMLARLFQLPVSRVELRHGLTSRDKSFFLHGPISLPDVDSSRRSGNRV